jgi:hypothetical protein
MLSRKQRPVLRQNKITRGFEKFRKECVSTLCPMDVLETCDTVVYHSLVWTTCTLQPNTAQLRGFKPGFDMRVAKGFNYTAVFFFWKTFLYAKSGQKFGRRGVVLVIRMPGIKGSGTLFRLASSWERTSGKAFRHNNRPATTNFTLVIAARTAQSCHSINRAVSFISYSLLHQIHTWSCRTKGLKTHHTFGSTRPRRNGETSTVESTRASCSRGPEFEFWSGNRLL